MSSPLRRVARLSSNGGMASLPPIPINDEMDRISDGFLFLPRLLRLMALPLDWSNSPSLVKRFPSSSSSKPSSLLIFAFLRLPPNRAVDFYFDFRVDNDFDNVSLGWNDASKFSRRICNDGIVTSSFVNARAKLESINVTCHRLRNSFHAGCCCCSACTFAAS